MPNIFINNDIKLEAVYEDKSSDKCLIITHPHSLMGGNMHNNVVMAAWNASLETGLSTLRFNFRGVGKSSGSFDEGNGEMDDLAGAINFVQKSVIIIGYSFGAWVAARHIERINEPVPCIFISPPNSMFQFPSMKSLPIRAITGDQDQFCNTNALEYLMDENSLTVIEHMDHFWFGDEDILASCIKKRLETFL